MARLNHRRRRVKRASGHTLQATMRCGYKIAECIMQMLLPPFSAGSMPALIFRALVAIALVVCPALASAQGLRVMARVNDDAITAYELNQRIVFAVRSTGRQDSPKLHQRLASRLLRRLSAARAQIPPPQCW